MCFSKEKDINIQEKIEILTTGCFKQAENAENVKLPESLITIEGSAFIDGENYKKIYIGKNVSDIAPNFKVKNYNGTVEIDKENPYYIVENDILYSKDKKTLICALKRIKGKFIVDSFVKNIEKMSFVAQSDIEEVLVPEGVTSIGNSSFSQCVNLKKIVLPSTINKIGKDVFERCNTLEYIVINNKKGSLTGEPWGAPRGDRSIKWLK